MTRNSQVINAMAMIPEAVTIWGRDTAASLTAQVRAQDRNIVSASVSRAVRMLTQVAMLGWGAFLALEGQITGGMVIAASIIAGRALAPIEGSIEGWNTFILSQCAYRPDRSVLHTTAKLQFETPSPAAAAGPARRGTAALRSGRDEAGCPQRHQLLAQSR